MKILEGMKFGSRSKAKRPHLKRCTKGITLGISKIVRKTKLFVVIHFSTGRRHFQDTFLPFGHDLLYPQSS